MAYVDWIKLEHTTPDKQEVLRMAEILAMNPYEVLGRLVKVWIWADQNLKDGNSSVTSLSQICHIAGVTNFGKAMLEAGWLQRVDGKLVFPNFLRHNGKSAKTRADTQKRVRLSRNCNSSVTDLSQDERYKDVTPSSSTSTSTSDVIKSSNIFNNMPEILSTDEFRNTWTKWRQYKSQQGFPVQPMQEIEIWSKLAAEGPEDAVEIVLHAIRKGWKSIVFDYEGRVRKSQQPYYPTGEEIMAKALKEQKERDDAKRAAQRCGTRADAGEPGDAEPGGVRGGIRDSAA